MAEEKKEAECSTRFDDNLFATMQQSNKDKSNLICSPLSVLSAMAIAAVGAKQNTLKQMMAVLFPQHQGDVTTEAITKSASELLALTASYNKEYDGQKKQPLITVANKLFVEKNFPILGAYVKASGVDSVDSFDKTQAAAAAKTINDWVAKITQNWIKQLVDANIMAAADLVIANAIYFHAKFKIPFDEKKTKQGVDFYTDRSRKNALSKVTMMNNKANYMCVRLVSGWTLIKLQYGDSKLSLVLAMEYKDDSKPLSVADLFDARTKWGESKINLFVPKFKYEYEVELNDVLKQMGITDAFGGGADFSGMSEAGGLHISNVIHKAVIEVDEKGTTAAAATAVVMTRSITPECHFDHPFPFFIVDDAHKVVLFCGRFEGK